MKLPLAQIVASKYPNLRPVEIKRLILAGKVRVDQHIVSQVGTFYPSDVKIQIIEDKCPYVSRGAFKLLGALEKFGIDLENKIVADIGASTGGFTEVCLEQGASKVYAIDVAKNELAWKIRDDDRVVPYDKTNIRHLEKLPELVDLIVTDVSFISLKLVLPKAYELLKNGAEMIALIKPQFEAGREEVNQGRGIIKDPAIHTRVKKEIIEFAKSIGFQKKGLIKSPITGKEGNVEFLVWLRKTEQ